MIYYLKGKIVIRKEEFLVIDVGGMGYKVLVSPEVKDSLKENATLYCFVQKGEKEDRIYGFKSEENLKLFERLLKISGIGPKTALTIASCASMEELKKGIEKEDKKVMEKIFSAGEKKGQQVIFEISRKMVEKREKDEEGKDEAYETLRGLGFKDGEIKKALRKVGKNEKKEKRVKEALKMLGNEEHS